MNTIKFANLYWAVGPATYTDNDGNLLVNYEVPIGSIIGITPDNKYYLYRWIDLQLLLPQSWPDRIDGVIQCLPQGWTLVWDNKVEDRYLQAVKNVEKKLIK